ncbi:MAG: restriction endonuclease [Oscillospiraceae bacterium]|nr:restriction endonuclease [Oscillospiraceae bacterium]
MNKLYYGDNLDIMREHIPDESVDLCYIDPPFNSKRDYNLIYDVGREDKAQATMFVDTWEWNLRTQNEFDEICRNDKGTFTRQTSDLIIGLHKILGKGDLLSYLVSMTLRVNEIYRVLKPTGTFYLHCDPTASHYLKLVLDSVFGAYKKCFLNEIIWCYNIGGKSKRHFARKHDVIFWYAKSKNYYFDGTKSGVKRDTGTKSSGGKMGVDEHGRPYQDKLVKSSGKYYRYYLDEPKIAEDWWIDIKPIHSQSKERYSYRTQKPPELLERIIETSSKNGDVVLDAFCGCGTTVAVAQKLERQWIGIDISYYSISLIINRLEKSYGKEVMDNIKVGGIPQDMEAAVALSLKKDDRLRKEFERWAVLTYSNNKAMINDKKGKDYGIDGVIRVCEGEQFRDALFSVKSGKVGAAVIRDFRGVIERENAAFGVFITLNPPTKDMKQEAATAGTYHNERMADFPKIKIVTIGDILNGETLDVPLAADVVKKVKAAVAEDRQLTLEE